MTSIAIKNWQRLRKHRVVKGVEGFLNWWWGELLDGLPPRLREFLSPPRERLTARMHSDEVWLRRDGEELGRFKVGDDEEIGRQVVGGALARFEDGRPRAWFLIDADEVLTQRLSLPAAAEDNLRSVLTYEMDRYTPYTADQVCFDVKMLEPREGSNQIRFELIIVPRATIDKIWKLAADRGLALDGIDVCRQSDDGALEEYGVNLLDPPRRARRDRRRAKIIAVLAGLFVALLYGVMWQSLVARERALEAFRAASDQAAAQAREVADLRDQLSEAREAALFLSAKKKSQPVVMNVLNEISRLLPDEVWIQRLQLNGDKVDLTGQAPEASTLLQLMEQSPCLGGAVAKGPFTPDVQSGKERFTIEVAIQCKGVGNGAAAAG